MVRGGKKKTCLNERWEGMRRDGLDGSCPASLQSDTHAALGTHTEVRHAAYTGSGVSGT
jgi:hypothetical protein